MIELIVGAILGTIGSLVITHIYYKRSSRELDQSISVIKNEMVVLQAISREIQDAASEISSDTDVILKHAVVGTTDDPAYPYK